jgi:RHS repeat-associated protein
VQHLCYLPFGEPWIDQRTTGWETRYTFTGKERDGESGYFYFGARYYDSDLSVWLSVDPMASKYPNTSNYAYVENNPIKYVDPNGMYKKESKAIKAQAKAVDRYGTNNVSGVERHPSTGRYSFRIAKDGFRQTGSTDSDGGIVIKKERGKEIKDNFRLGLYNLFNPKGGQYGTADNGQGQETRSGDGQKTDLGEFTSDMPGYNPTTGEIGSGGDGKDVEGTSGVFHVSHTGADGKPTGPYSSRKYEGTADSLEKMEQYKDWEKPEKGLKFIIKVEVNE